MTHLRKIMLEGLEEAQLFTVQKLAPGSVTNHLCALRFFYIQTLKKPWSMADTRQSTTWGISYAYEFIPYASLERGAIVAVRRKKL